MPFHVIVLGCGGGPYEDDLSGYLLYPAVDPEQLIALDAGSFLHGIEVAAARDSFCHMNFTSTTLDTVGEICCDKIKALLISHAHLDHILGLVMASPFDVPNKVLMATQPTIDYFKDHVFNWAIWANMANEGIPPCLNRYTYLSLPLETSIAIPRTEMCVEAFRLSHPGEYQSTAFFISSGEETLLYIGDTSPDDIEKTKRLRAVWKKAGQFLRAGSLRGLALECSVAEAGAADVPYGHLSSSKMLGELRAFQEIAGTSLKGLKVIVMHRKRSFVRTEDQREVIEQELMAGNDMGLDLIFPCQGDLIVL